MLPAVFHSWVFPGVPRTARLHYAPGVQTFPAGATALLNGESEWGGGTGWLFNPKQHLRTGDFRAQLLAIGWGLVDPLDSLGGTAALAAGVPQSLYTILGYGPGSTDRYFRALQLDADASKVALRFDGVNDAAHFGATAGDPGSARLVLSDVYVPAAADVVQVAGGANVRAAGVIDHKDQMSEVRGRVQLVRVDAGGALVAGQATDLGYDAAPVYGESLRHGERPTLYPVHPSAGGVKVNESEAVALLVDDTIGVTGIPATVKVRALAVVATWTAADEKRARHLEVPRGPMEV